MTDTQDAKRDRATAINAQTTVSLGLLLTMIALFFKLMNMTNELVRWQERVDSRLVSLENRVSSRPDPWSGTMMQVLVNDLERELRGQSIAIKPPDVRAIQKAGAELEWGQSR